MDVVATFSGDFAKIARWSQKLRDISSPKVMFEIADTQADIALGLVAEEFSRESDPYFRRWAPKKKPDGRPILRGETNRLVTWRKAFVNQHGYRVESTAPYSRYHQSGTKRMVARKMVPDRNLPPRWSSELRGAALARVHRLLTSR